MGGGLRVSIPALHTNAHLCAGFMCSARLSDVPSRASAHYHWIRERGREIQDLPCKGGLALKSIGLLRYAGHQTEWFGHPTHPSPWQEGCS